jgi:hypothetical protein
VLEKGPYDRSGPLGPKRQALSSGVHEGIHLLLHDVCILTYASGEKLCLLENGSPDLGIPVALQNPSSFDLQVLPFLDFGGKNIRDAGDTLDHEVTFPVPETRLPNEEVMKMSEGE